MGNLYGFVLAGMFPPIVIFFSVVIFLKRNHPFIKNRKPDFILVQNVGTLVSFLICSLYIAFLPNYDCKLIVLSSTLNISVTGYIILIRFWEYCIKFHVALVKTRFRFNEFAPTWSEPSWIYRNLWISKHYFILKVLIVGIIVLTVPVFGYFAPTVHLPLDEVTNLCITPLGWTICYCALASIMLLLGIVAAFFLRNSRDAYRLRHEALAQCALWIVVFFCMFMYPKYAPNEIQQVVPSVFFHLVGLFFTLCIGNIIPLFYAFKYDLSEVKNGTYEQFLQLLEYPAFRNVFYKFLTEQFCGENLQFYETVQAWKALDPCDEKKRSHAQLIYEHFVSDEGLCQVNMHTDTRCKIFEQLTKAVPPQEIFDTAYHALLEDMYFNSFLIFRSTMEYRETTVVELV